MPTTQETLLPVNTSVDRSNLDYLCYKPSEGIRIFDRSLLPPAITTALYYLRDNPGQIWEHPKVAQFAKNGVEVGDAKLVCQRTRGVLVVNYIFIDKRVQLLIQAEHGRFSLQEPRFGPKIFLVRAGEEYIQKNSPWHR